MLNRKIDRDIEKHFASSKKALFLTGARQVGKTYAIRKYARLHNLHLVEMNFLLQPETISMFKNVGDIKELHAHGWNLYYFNSKKQGEIDFLLEADNEIIPIEVKSGKDYERHNALSNVMANPDYGIKKAYVLCNDNLHKRGNVEYIPIYMTMFIQKNRDVEDLVYKVDLSEL